MKNRICLLFGLLALVQNLSAAGLIIVHEADFWRRPPPRIVPPEIYPPPPRPPYYPRPHVWAPLETTFTKADVRIKDQFATTVVEQEFYNPNSQQMEGTFLFPVPKGAQINKFTMEIEGKQVDAELLAADKARSIYEDIVRKLRDPALLEYADRDLFKVRIYPIEAHSRKYIKLSYSQLLKADGGVVTFQFPLNTEKFSAKPIKTVSLKVDLETRRPLKSIYSPSHKVEIRRQGGTQATVGYEATDVKPESDFQLLFSQEQADIGMSLLTYRTPGEDGYFVLLASPGAETKSTKVIPKDVTFVLDTSGSMAGPKLEQAKKALLFCVENLNPTDRFEILRFATEVDPLFEKLVDASNEHRQKARTFIEDLKPIGGTAIDEALRRAMALRPETGERPYLIIFLTDGRPTVGTTAEPQILGNVTQASRGNVRVFCFGIGTDVNTHLLDKITEETRAVSQYVLPTEDLEVKVSTFFSKIKEPVLASPRIIFPESLRVTRLHPGTVPDLFKGEQLILVGRYSGKGEGAIQIEGKVNGETKRFAQDTKFPEDAKDHEFIPRLWATRRVGFLLDEIRLRGENKELKDEVVELARRYSIVTPYTAYLIVEDEKRREVAGPLRTIQLENDAQHNEMRGAYNDFMKAKDGDRAVASARSYYRLKSADAPGEAIIAGNSEALMVAPATAPSATAAAGRFWATNGSRAESKVLLSERTAREYAQQSQFVAGKTFFQNQGQWVDSSAQATANAKRVRVQFASPEYFVLAQKDRRAQAWLALGNNIQFVLDGTLYEIYE